MRVKRKDEGRIIERANTISARPAHLRPPHGAATVCAISPLPRRHRRRPRQSLAPLHQCILTAWRAAAAATMDSMNRAAVAGALARPWRGPLAARGVGASPAYGRRLRCAAGCAGGAVTEGCGPTPPQSRPSTGWGRAHAVQEVGATPHTRCGTVGVSVPAL